MKNSEKTKRNYQCSAPSNLTWIQSRHSSVITVDSIDRISSSSSSIDEQLDAINFLEKYLEHANRDVLVEFFSDMARAIRSHATMNNHLQFISTRQSKLQRSNNKEKNQKKEKSTKFDETKEDELKRKKAKKKSDKKKYLDESTTSSEVYTMDSPTLTIPVPQPNTFISPSPSPSPIYAGQTSNVAQLSHVQQQLQTDTQTSMYHRVSAVPNVSIEEQLATLSQMAKNGDELLITLSIHPVHRQYVRSTSIPPVQMNISSPLEIVARGFARLQTNDASDPLQSNVQPMPCNSINVPPSNPIGPPIRPMPLDQSHRPHDLNKCNDLCEKSIYQPDFRGRPAPGVIINPFYPSDQRIQSNKTKLNPCSTVFNSSINRTHSSFY